MSKKIFMLSSLITSTALAGGPDCATTDKLGGLKLDFGAEAALYNFKGDGGSILAVVPELTVSGIAEGFTVFAELPVYSNENTTGLGDLTLGASYRVWEDKASFGFAWLNIHAGADIPTAGGELGSENVNPFVGFIVGIDGLGGNGSMVDLSQTFDYKFVGGNAFNPYLGGQTDADIIFMRTDVDVPLWGDALVGALTVKQQYTIDPGEQQLFVGPSFVWKPTCNTRVDFGVDLPVWQDLQSFRSENNVVVSGGITINF
jgi:hypothetical protein